jgi:predicted dinucleotide-binding enzyme
VTAPVSAARVRVGIIGAGNVGVGLGRRLAARGHDVVVSFARSAEKVQAAAAAIGGGARAGTPEDAARHGDVVIVATPWGATVDALRPLAGALAGTVVWDATNPLKPDLSGLSLGLTTSGGEEVANALPGARVGKAVPPFAAWLQSDATDIAGRKPAVFVCGDDAAARGAVRALVADLDADAVDAGPLANARYTEPLGMLLVQLAYAEGLGPRIGVAFLR